MIERTILAALVMGGVGFGLFSWMLHRGQSEFSAHNTLLLLMVLFENIHLGNCRSETQSAFHLSPLRSPILLIGTATAFLIHVLAMHLPIANSLLSTAPIDLPTWGMLVSLSLTVLAALEIHKFGRSQLLQRWRTPTAKTARSSA